MSKLQTKILTALKTNKLNPTKLGERKWYNYFISVDELNHSAVKKLEQLKKYFESGNEIPVDRAVIKASDFWKIYNGS